MATKKEWFDKVQENKDALVLLVKTYHPVYLKPNSPKKKMNASITAPNAERACEVVRSQIRKETLGNPVQQFKTAIEQEDTSTVYSMLSKAWFGVPESTSCWVIPGFKEACDLMDDLPDEE